MGNPKPIEITDIEQAEPGDHSDFKKDGTLAYESISFSDYFLAESFIRELVAKYDNINLAQMAKDYPKMMQCCISWAAINAVDNPKVEKKLDVDIKALFRWCERYRNQAIEMLKDLHELEYKQSQLKRYYSRSDVMTELELTMTRIAKWLQMYLCVVLFSRASGDGLYQNVGDYEAEIAEYNRGNFPDVATVIKNFGSLAHGVARMGDTMYDNYVTPVFVELYRARTLPQLLIAISKAKNAEHDGGPIMTEWGTGLFRDEEDDTAFRAISNLNYRKMDRELQEELSESYTGFY